MKKNFKKLAFGILGLAIFGFGYLMFTGHQPAEACGWGGSGGQGYVPQQRGNQMGPLASKPAVTQEQAFDIVSNHIRKLNPDLRVGQINDAGNFYEAEVLSKDNEVVQLIGVDKLSGRLMLIN
ncbi:MAG TPA: hypothetical protein HPQ03_13785 [Deltaproteobacteria bacterium]|nr:hypothetical protein [Deltaproteobacteria bacterium]